MQTKRVASQEPGTERQQPRGAGNGRTGEGWGGLPSHNFPCKVLRQPLPPPHRHPHARRCQDTAGNITVPEPRCLRPERAGWGAAAPAPGAPGTHPALGMALPRVPGKVPGTEGAIPGWRWGEPPQPQVPSLPADPILFCPCSPISPIPSFAPPPLHTSPAPLHLPQSDLFFPLATL